MVYIYQIYIKCGLLGSLRIAAALVIVGLGWV